MFRWGLAAAVAVIAAATAGAATASREQPPLGVQPRGGDVATALLLTWYGQLPERRPGDDEAAWARRLQAALEKFRADVAGRYSEGTLQRLADHPQARVRRAALLALRLAGTMASNEAVAGRLRDDDEQVRQVASEALWALWFRADGEASQKELQRAMQQADPQKAVAAMSALVRKSPQFAEAYNQRAIVHFRQGEYDKCAADCEKVLRLNAQHFGAAAGLGRCYLRLRLPGPALKAFRTAHKINPHLDGVEDAIRDLESVLGEEGKE
jgi:tetratricopeptide (TPR) repeat protein